MSQPIVDAYLTHRTSSAAVGVGLARRRLRNARRCPGTRADGVTRLGLGSDHPAAAARRAHDAARRRRFACSSNGVDGAAPTVRCSGEHADGHHRSPA